MKNKYLIPVIISFICLGAILVFTMSGGDSRMVGKSGQAAAPADQIAAVEGQATPDNPPSQVGNEEPAPKSASPAIPEKKKQASIPREHQDSLAAFADWLEKYLQADAANRVEMLAAGVELAEARSAVMASLIEGDPEAALSHSLSYYEYDQLPDSLKNIVEQPFSSRANVVIIPDETASGTGPIAFLETSEGGYKSRRLFLYGQRQHLSSKNQIAVQGIILKDVATVYDAALQVISRVEDLAWVHGNLALRNSDRSRDFLTGEEIGNEPVVAVAGGSIFYFASEENVHELNKKLAAMEGQVGPDIGSQALFINAMQAEGSSLTFAATLAEVPVAASTWTETAKKVFFIRVDFSDKPGASVSKADLLAQLNGDVTAYIEEYSYNKTWLEADVSDAVVRVPQVSGNYVPSNYMTLLNDAKTAFNALATGINLADYDIIGVHFTEIGYSWAGLASIGVGRVWIEDTISTSVIVHEIGHNYGLYHANFWDTGGASVVGSGANEEYGDIFDRMGSGSVQGHFHMQGKARLNWLSSSEWTDVSSSGLYRVYRFDNVNAQNNQALRIDKAAGEYYWLGYRLNLTDNSFLQNGAYLIWQQTSSQSWLIDTTPGSPEGKEDAAVAIGRTYSDTAANVHITPVAKGGTAPDEWLDVQVNIGDFASNNDPTVSLTAPGTLTVRSPLTFSADASDIDGDDLAYYWDFGDGVQHASASAIAHTWAVGGDYTVTVTVSDMKGGTATDQVSVTVDDPLNQWHARTTNSTRDLYDIATDGSQVMAVGRRAVFVSSDGTDWTSLGQVGTNVYLYGLIYADNQWVGAGIDYNSGWIGTIFTSPDGSSWTNRYSGGPELRDIATNGTVHVAVGDSGTILRSTDGVNWQPQPSGTTLPLRSVAYGSNTFTAVGASSSGGPVVVLTSSDGINWTDHSAGAGLASWQGFYAVGYLNDRFLASGWFSKLRYSNDNGATFTTTRSSTEEMPALAYGNSVYFAAGIEMVKVWLDQTTYTYQEVDTDLASLDGVHWYNMATPSLDDRNGAIFFNDTFITVGNNGSIRQSDPIAPVSPPIDPAGDVNDDGSVDLADVILTLQVMVGITPASPPVIGSDVNGDGRIGHAEAIYALQSAAGLAPK